MLKKLRVKFVAINMIIITAMLLLIFAAVYRSTAADLENESIRALQTLTQGIQQPGGVDSQVGKVRMPHFTIRINFSGDVSVSGTSYLDLTDKALIRSLIQDVYTYDGTTGYLRQYNLQFARGTTMGQQYVIFVDVSGQRTALNALVRTGVIVGIISLGAFLIISILLARWAVRPVEKAWQQQRQFVSDASHELKTPLTVIMSNAELMQSDADEQSKIQFTENILTMSRHMRSLVEGLLELARADNGQIKKQFADVELSTLVNDTLLPFEAVLYEQQLLLQSEISPEIRIYGSEGYMRQVVEVLIDNAIKYASPGVVKVKLQRQSKGQCLLTVSNPGEPIPREELEKIFDRFYRTDKARSRTGSFGLGLSIAKSIVTEHGGKIWAESNETGNCFFVQLPRVSF